MTVEEQPLLVDFGFANRMNSLNTYSGTYHYASPRILGLLFEGHDQFTFKPDDDLISILCCFYFNKMKSGNFVEDFKCGHFKDIKEFWEGAFEPIFWKQMYDAAKKCDYAKLKEYMRNI